MEFGTNCVFLGFGEGKTKAGKDYLKVRFGEEDGQAFETFCSDTRLFNSVKNAKLYQLYKIVVDVRGDSCFNCFAGLKAFNEVKANKS